MTGRAITGLGVAGRGVGLGAGLAGVSSPDLTGEGRDFSPSRCALPITALRLTPPSSSAIWLAVNPRSSSAKLRAVEKIAEATGS